MKTIHIAVKWNEDGDVIAVSCEENITDETMSTEFHQMIDQAVGDFTENFKTVFGSKGYPACRECLNQGV